MDYQQAAADILEMSTDIVERSGGELSLAEVRGFAKTLQTTTDQPHKEWDALSYVESILGNTNHDLDNILLDNGWYEL